MFTNPYLTSQLTEQRHRDMLADARHHRLVRQLRSQAAAARQPQRPGPRLRRALRAAARLRALPGT